MKIKELNYIRKIKTKVILIKIIETKGSVPRNKNVSMVISSKYEFGTIGGGELEFRAIKEALELLKKSKQNEKILEFPLGPALGQCCGGYIKIHLIKFINGEKLLNISGLENQIIDRNKNLYIFGAGHVGNALSNKLDGVGFNIFIVDSREKLLSKIQHNYINLILAKRPEIIIKNAPLDSYFLVMTYSHKIDFLICSHILKLNKFSFLGLIGSKTKKIRFIKRLIEMGYDKNLIEKIECPIGKNSIIGKEPDVIAISIIARLLEFKSNLINNQIKKQIKLVHG